MRDVGKKPRIIIPSPLPYRARQECRAYRQTGYGLLQHKYSMSQRPDFEPYNSGSRHGARLGRSSHFAASSSPTICQFCGSYLMARLFQ